MRRFIIGLVLVLFTVSCGDDETGPNTSATVTTQAATTSQVLATTTPTTTATTTPTTQAATTQAPTTTTLPPLPPVECSAAGLAGGLANEPELPVVVDATRRAIFNTAVACDIEGLAAIAQPGGFIWNGAPTPGDDPTENFRSGEEHFGLMAIMLNLFSAPYGAKNMDGVTAYVWPAAAAYPDWASVPEFARQGLVDLYGEGILEEAAEYLWEEGYYQGSELVIDETGNWRVYWLAGN